MPLLFGNDNTFSSGADFWYRVFRDILLLKYLQPFLFRCIFSGDKHLPASVITYRSCQFPCIYPRYPGYIIFFHDCSKRARASEIGRLVVVFPDYQSPHGGSCGFKIILRHPVVADQRVSHDHSLICIGRIGKYFLISDHWCIKNYLQDPVPFSSEAFSVIFLSVLKD